MTTSFTYAPSGERLTKTSGGVTHDYFWQNGLLLRETYGDNELEFLYDGAGSPLGFLYNDTAYFYVKNLQGDVVRVINVSGSVVASYSYSAYGEILSSSGTMADINPIRYRGYYYDTETGFYYLGGRYYDPELCRFINADQHSSTGQGFIGMNKFSYCGNNPVVRIDADGQYYHVLIGAGAGALIGMIMEIIDNRAHGEAWYKNLDRAFVFGAANGALAACGVPTSSVVLGSAVLSGGRELVDQYAETGDFSEINFGNVLIQAGWGAFAGRVGSRLGGSVNFTTQNNILTRALQGSWGSIGNGIRTYWRLTGTTYMRNLLSPMMRDAVFWPFAQDAVTAALRPYITWSPYLQQQQQQRSRGHGVTINGRQVESVRRLPSGATVWKYA